MATLTDPLVVAVVPVHNRLPCTARFLEAARRITYGNLRVVVVDDGSVDGTGEWIRQHHPEVHLISADGDRWWAGATNLGVRWALREQADFVLTINDDATFDPDFLARLVACAHVSGNALVGSRLMWADRPNRIWSLGVRCRWNGNRLWDQIGRDEEWPAAGAARGPRIEADALCGNGTLVPVGVFRTIGLYDERNLPQYHADADLVLRARRAGWRAVVETASVVRNDPASSQIIRGLWWSMTSRRSPLYLPALLTILARWCPAHRMLPLLVGQFLPIAFPSLRRRPCG